MIEKNALYLHLDAYDEEYPERYMDGGDLSAETAQRMLVYTESLLRRPDEVFALESEWEDWWPLADVFIEVYAPHVEPYQRLAPVRTQEIDELSPADRRYLTELLAALRRYVDAQTES